MSVFLKMGLAGDASLIKDAERTVAKVATSVNGKDRLEEILTVTKYPDEPPGFGTSSREAKGQPIKKKKFECQAENVGDDTY